MGTLTAPHDSHKIKVLWRYRPPSNDEPQHLGNRKLTHKKTNESICESFFDSFDDFNLFFYFLIIKTSPSPGQQLAQKSQASFSYPSQKMLVGSILLLLIAGAHARNYYWNGGTMNFSQPANWQGNFWPGANGTIPCQTTFGSSNVNIISKLSVSLIQKSSLRFY